MVQSEERKLEEHVEGRVTARSDELPEETTAAAAPEELHKLLNNGNAHETTDNNSKDAQARIKAKLKREKSEQDRLMTEEINKLLHDMPLEKNVTCGFWIFRGDFFQR